MITVKYKNPETNQIEQINVDEADWRNFKRSRYAVGKRELQELKKRKIGFKSFEKAEWVNSVEAVLGFGGSIYMALFFITSLLLFVNPVIGIAVMGGTLLLGGLFGVLWGRGHFMMAKEDNEKQDKELSELGNKSTYVEYLESNEFIAQLQVLAAKSREELEAIHTKLPDDHLLKDVILELADPALAASSSVKSVQKRLADQYLAPLYVKAQTAKAPSQFAPAIRYGVLAVSTLGVATMLGGIALGIASAIFALPILTAVLTGAVVTSIALIVGLPFALGITALKQKIESLKTERAKAIGAFKQQQDTKEKLIEHMQHLKMVTQGCDTEKSLLKNLRQNAQASVVEKQVFETLKTKFANIANGAQVLQTKVETLQEENTHLSQKLAESQKAIHELQAQIIKYQTVEREHTRSENVKKIEILKKGPMDPIKPETNFFERPRRNILRRGLSVELLLTH